MKDTASIRDYWIRGRANLQPLSDSPLDVKRAQAIDRFNAERAAIKAQAAVVSTVVSTVASTVIIADLPAFMAAHPGARIVARDGGWPVVEVKA